MVFRVPSGSSRAQKLFKSRVLSNPAGLGIRTSTLLTVPNPYSNILAAGIPRSATEKSFRDLSFSAAISNSRRRSSFNHCNTQTRTYTDQLGRNIYYCDSGIETRSPRVLSDSVPCVGDVHTFVDSSIDLARQTRAENRAKAHAGSSFQDTYTDDSSRRVSGATKLLPQLHAHAEHHVHVHQFRDCAVSASASEPTPLAASLQEADTTRIRTPCGTSHGSLNTRSVSTMTEEHCCSISVGETMSAEANANDPTTQAFAELGLIESESVPSVSQSFPNSTRAPPLEYRRPSSPPKMVRHQAPYRTTLSSKSASPETRPYPNHPHVAFTSNVSSGSPTSPTPTTQALEPSRRSLPPDTRPELRIRGGVHMSDEYVLTVQLPVTMAKCLTTEMITVSARKENKLAIVVDVWHAENNCHLEWLVSFAPYEVNVSSSRAHIGADGTLTIRVPRLCQQLQFMWSRLQ